MTAEATEKPHPLKDRWFVSYFPVVKQKKFSKDSEEQKGVELDWVSTAEELHATINAFSPLTLLPPDDNLVFAREKVEPFFENFPNGMRVSVFTRTKVQATQAVPLVLAAVMGEHLRTVTDGPSHADVVRIAHKPGTVYPESLRVEVWLRDRSKVDAVTKYFSEMLAPHPGIRVAGRPINAEGEEAK
ncbi:Eukaryotic translation initiation factor 4E type 6 [Trypanosoma brucei equiperdum]|uniref:Eukaryotic translation initiation factor 4E type 6 n=1 Tax=Trypanosoma brucei equiperdum TaxID=630700 RepID=A0A3L6L5A4_9TRYP|nr:Eukaryotic translation initiation factor 4E type 6 [Trypanosoma brucei equiperdum]